ncbi:hypothetical protein [Chitinophaga sp. S165]|uniref:hypothetical protein n=1 Tax=Chitinophaga sp. S165 TaxID=2135462 RepID=UPI000D713716|nr:hypothetical protein [Chitinophaga sp. S165]PWV51925.1 hypothetical protein C7475_103535 [Chitinophaga sp. S165]
MKFNIYEDPDMLFNRTNAIPFSCALLVKHFAKSSVLSCPYLDIVYQERAYQGFKVRTLIYNVRESITLLTGTKRKRLVLQNMLYGTMPMEIESIGTVVLNENTCALIQYDSNQHACFLEPGKYQTIYFEYAKDILQKQQSESAVVDQWLHQLQFDKCFLYHQDVDVDALKKMQHEITSMIIDSPLREELFRVKMQQSLLMLLESKQLLTQ